jgi:hypothetical protein
MDLLGQDDSHNSTHPSGGLYLQSASVFAHNSFDYRQPHAGTAPSCGEKRIEDKALVFILNP